MTTPGRPLGARFTRRLAVATAAIGAGVLTRRVPQAGAFQQAAFASGALGLTRQEIETRWGPGDRVDMPGHPIYDETYAYAGQGWTYTVWYRSLNGDEIASYVEVSYGPDGVANVQAMELAESLLPDDAEYTEMFVAPATPHGPTALVMTRYVSDALGVRSAGAVPPEILVTLHKTWDDGDGSDDRVTAVSIMARTVTQRG